MDKNYIHKDEIPTPTAPIGPQQPFVSPTPEWVFDKDGVPIPKKSIPRTHDPTTRSR